MLSLEELARGQQFAFYIHKVLTKMTCIFPFLTTACVQVKTDFTLSFYDSFFSSSKSYCENYITLEQIKKKHFDRDPDKIY